MPQSDPNTDAHAQSIHGTLVRGIAVRAKTQCAHYHSSLDIIAIRFRCCDTFYCCSECHEILADHAAKVWPKEEFDTQAVLCGKCGHRLSISQYLSCGFRCPNCQAAFNPGCASHYSHYFAV